MKHLLFFLTVFPFLASAQILEKQFIATVQYSGFTQINDSLFRGDLIEFRDVLIEGYQPSGVDSGFICLDGTGRAYRIEVINSFDYSRLNVDLIELDDYDEIPIGVGIVAERYGSTYQIPNGLVNSIGISSVLQTKILNHNTKIAATAVQPPDTLYLKEVSGVTAISNGDTIDVSPYLFKYDTAAMLSNYPTFGDVNTSLGNYLPILGGTLTGTGGAGFLGLPAQSGTPTTPVSGFKLFANGAHNLGILDRNGWITTFDISTTANRDFTYPATGGTFALGTGTADRLARWAGTNTLAAGNLSDNGTKLQALLPWQFHSWTTAGRPTGVTGYTGYNTTGNGIEWYQGSRWAYALESTFARGTATRIPFFDANGQVTDNANLTYNGTTTLNFAERAFNLSYAGSITSGATNYNGYLTFYVNRNSSIRGASSGNSMSFHSFTPIDFYTSSGLSMSIRAGGGGNSLWIPNGASTGYTSNSGIGTVGGIYAGTATLWGTNPITAPANSIISEGGVFTGITNFAQISNTAILQAISTTKSSAPFPLHTTAQSNAITGENGNFEYITDGVGPALSWYNGTRKAYALESAFARGTTGSVPFFDANGQIAQNNSNLFWGNTNGFLGLKTATPLQELDVNGDALVRDTIFNTSPATHSTIDGLAVWKNTAQGYALGKGTVGSGLSYSGGVLSATGGGNSIYNNLPVGNVTIDADGHNLDIENLTELNFYSQGGNGSIGFTDKTFQVEADSLINLTTTSGTVLEVTDKVRMAGNVRAQIPGNGHLLFSQLFNSNADSMYLYFRNYGDGERSFGFGLTDTVSTGYTRAEFSSDGTGEMNWELKTNGTSGTTSVKSDAGALALSTTDASISLNATVDNYVNVTGYLAAKQEAYNEITSTSSPQTLSSQYSDNLINQGGTQATFTLEMPASPEDGQICTITFNNAISTLTIDGNGETIVGSAVTTGVPGSQRKFKFYSGIGWIKLY